LPWRFKTLEGTLQTIACNAHCAVVVLTLRHWVKRQL